MFDTHCHLFDKAFKGNLDNVILNAREAGITYFLIPAVNIETSKEGVSLNALYQDVYSTVGIHPTENLEVANIDRDEKILDELCRDKKVIALGETGLDYYRFKSSPEVQKKYLSMHIKLALKHEKALILHNRQSTSDLLKLLTDTWQESLTGKVVFHCASLEDELVDFAKKHKCFLGIDGDITYDKFKQNQIKNINIEQIVLETDSPYLLPEPLKSQKAYPNNPANLNIIATFVASILNISMDNLIERTTSNAKLLFDVK